MTNLTKSVLKPLYLVTILGCLFTPAIGSAQTSSVVRVSQELVRFAVGLRVTGKTSASIPLQNVKFFKKLSPAQQGRLIAIRDTKSIQDALFLLQDSIEIGLFSVAERQALFKRYERSYVDSEAFQINLINTLEELGMTPRDQLVESIQAISPMRVSALEAATEFIYHPSEATLELVINTLKKPEYRRLMTHLGAALSREHHLTPTIHPTLYYIQNFYTLTKEPETSGEMGAQVYFWLQQISQQLQAKGVLNRDPQTGILSSNYHADPFGRPEPLHELTITLAFFRQKFREGWFKDEIKAHQAWREKTGEIPLEQRTIEAPNQVNHQTTCWARDAEALLATLEDLVLSSPKNIFSNY